MALAFVCPGVYAPGPVMRHDVGKSLRVSGKCFVRRSSFHVYGPPLRHRSRSYGARHGARMSVPVKSTSCGPLQRLDADDDMRESFATAVKGEWPGFMAEFDVETGKAQVIPELYIPEEFFEWDQFPLGFETNNSVILRGSRLFQKRFLILPSVNLFGDHVDLEEEMSIIDVEEEAGFHATSCGTFTSGPNSVAVKCESILDKRPRAELALRVEKRAARVAVKFDFETGEFLEPLIATIEKWDCIHCDGGNVDGSSGFVDGWASEPAMSAEDLKGTWSSTDPKQNLVERPNGGAPHEAKKQLYLPGGLDVNIRKSEDGGIVLTLGRLFEGNTRYVLSRCYGPDGIVAKSDYHVETRQEQ